MGLRKILAFFQIILFMFLLCGCGIRLAKEVNTIKSPANNSLAIKGVWKVKSVKKIDENNTPKDILGENIEISNEAIKIEDNTYEKPNFKLKVVDKKYVISYESQLTIEPFMSGEDKVDVISVIDNNNLICDFILIKEDNGYVIYRGMILEVERTSKEVNIDLSNKRKGAEENDNKFSNEYDSDVGVMFALKTPITKSTDGTYTEETYRTLWISYKDGKLQPIMQKENIIFPRMNGIWKLNKECIKENGSEKDYFHVAPYEHFDNIIKNYSKVNNNISTYKSIRFVGNDYIAIERYDGTDFKNRFSRYQIVPVDNINSEKGLSIGELYSKNEMEKYKIDFENKLNTIDKGHIIDLNTKIDYSNISVRRKDGRWGLIGKISSINGEGSGVDFNVGLNINNKLLNYNMLSVPWKVLRGEVPFTKDAYTSPTGRLAIVMFKNNLDIYEIENRQLKPNPLINVELNSGEKVIMAEWCSGSYVNEWQKVFEDGEILTD